MIDSVHVEKSCESGLTDNFRMLAWNKAQG